MSSRVLLNTSFKSLWDYNSPYWIILNWFVVLFRSSHPEVFLAKRCFENMQQIYRRTPMPKCDFNSVALQLYWNRTSTCVFSCKFAAYFQNTFSYVHLWTAASDYWIHLFCLPLDLPLDLPLRCSVTYNATPVQTLLY